jgi:predicted benzoate:H+ symporter BenE
VLIWFGLFYIAAGAYYGVPMGVQPMKAASAAVLIQQMTPGEVSGAGLVIGAFFLILGATGLVSRVSRLIPPHVTAGIQLGLGVSLAILGARLIEQQLWLGLVVATVMLLLLSNRRFPAALVGLGFGVALAAMFGPRMTMPALDFGLHLPGFIWPTWSEFITGTEVMVLPQIPLTLTNAIIVTAAVTHQLFPKDVHHVNERNLAVTTGIGNLLAAPFGGYLMCLGAGGIAGHYRFGARTAAAPVLIGATFLLMGVLLGDSAIPLFHLIPAAVLGSLLFYSGLELALSSQPQRYAGHEIFVVLVIAVVSIGTNPAIACLIGLPLAYGIQRGWVRL